MRGKHVAALGFIVWMLGACGHPEAVVTIKHSSSLLGETQEIESAALQLPPRLMGKISKDA